MRKYRKLRDKIFTILNIALADEFFQITWEHTGRTKYDAELRGSFKVAEPLKTDIFNAMHGELVEHHDAKQIQANEEVIKKFSKGN